MKFPQAQKLIAYTRLRHMASNMTAALVVLVVAGIGAYLLVTSHAASPYVTQEAANGTVTNPAEACDDSGASSGKAVQFGGNPCLPSNAFNVTAYGADPTGKNDSSPGIRAAVAAAEAKGGTQTVYFPAGTYLLDDATPGEKLGTTNTGVAEYADLYFDGSSGSVINVLGAGANTTKVIEAVGVSNSNFPNTTRGYDVFVFRNMNNFYFSGLTVDSQTYNAGDTLIDFGNDTTVENDNFEGTTIANQTTNPNVFDMRVINVCGPVPTTNEGALAGYDTSHFSYGNTVNNVTVSGDGSGGADDLDFSCERDGTVSNITDDGWGTALYEDYNTTVTGYHFTPGFRNPDYPGFYITDSSGITINNFTSSGEGGIIAGGTIQGSDQTTFNTTIKNEKMTGSGFKLTVNDSDNTTINDSLLGNIGLYAPVGINGLRLSSTTSGAVTCSNAENITDLTGLACP